MTNHLSGRYDRQLLLPEIGEEGQRRLSQAKVLLVGVGGLGSPIALYLTGAGVGTLGLVDDDVVGVSNLQRQVLYDEAQVNQSKALCARERLLSLNSSIQVVAYPERLTRENAEALIAQYDMVVDGCDNFSTRFVINDACVKLHKPYIYGAINGLDGQVSVLNVDKANYRTLFPDEAETLSMPHPGKAVVGVTPGLVGVVEASQVIQLICQYGEPLIDKLWTIDLRTLQSFVIDI